MSVLSHGIPRTTRRAEGLTMDLKRILRPIEADLQHVKDRLLKYLQDPVARNAVYLITAGGKQLRPALVLLAGHSGAYDKRREALLDLAVAAELIHTATLIHDDIIDNASLRRRQPTFHQRFGTERAVLMGDYLYAVAFSVLAGLREPAITTAMAGVCQRLSVGEFLEVDSRFDVGLTDTQYLAIIRDKTASLIAACCRLGASVAGATPETVDRLERFGLHFGMAFQIMDDCLDLIGEEQLVGKTLGQCARHRPDQRPLLEPHVRDQPPRHGGGELVERGVVARFRHGEEALLRDVSDRREHRAGGIRIDQSRRLQ